MVRVPTNAPPSHPGELLLAEFLSPLGLTQRQLADGIHVPYQRINELVNGKRGITPNTALRLAKYFGTSADVWLNMQLRWDLYHAQREESAALGRIKSVRVGEAFRTEVSSALDRVADDCGFARVRRGRRAG